MTDVIREYEVKLTVRVALREPIYGKGEPPYKPAFTPTTAEVSEAVKEVLTMEETTVVERPRLQKGSRSRDEVTIDFDSVAVNFAAGAPPGFLDSAIDRAKGATIAMEERERRREQDDIAKHAEQRSVEREERE